MESLKRNGANEMATHLGTKLSNGSFRVPCAAGRKNSEGARWMTAKHFDALPVEMKCKHCVKERAAQVKNAAAKKAADEARARDAA